jgi:nucleotide-binding universal stress UspA family protein
VVENHWLGSVSHHLAGHAPCDVAVVRAQHDPDSQRVLVGVDGSASSARALDRACVLAASTGGHVLAVHAYRDHRIRTDGLAVLPEDVDTAAADAAQRDAETFVAAAVRAHPDVPLRATAVVGRPAEVLARLSDDAALVVVGTRGRTTFAELLLGSVAQETLYRAECPVLVVR